MFLLRLKHNTPRSQWALPFSSADNNSHWLSPAGDSPGTHRTPAFPEESLPAAVLPEKSHNKIPEPRLHIPHDSCSDGCSPHSPVSCH